MNNSKLSWNFPSIMMGFGFVLAAVLFLPDSAFRNISMFVYAGITLVVSVSGMLPPIKRKLFTAHFMGVPASLIIIWDAFSPNSLQSLGNFLLALGVAGALAFYWFQLSKLN